MISRYLICGMVLAIFAFITLNASAGDITVDDDWPGADHSTIQAAVDAAADSDRILVHAGTYDEEVTVDVQVSFVGNGTNLTFVVGLNQSAVFNVTAQYVGFEEMNISNGHDAGIIYHDAGNGTVQNCNVSSNWIAGIRIQNSWNMTITGNEICCNGDGIFVNASNNTLISENEIMNNSAGGGIHNDGVRAKYGVRNLTIMGNFISDNAYGVHLDSVGTTDFWNINVTYNYIMDHSSEGILGIWVKNSSFDNNGVYFNWDGIVFDDSNNVHIAFNEVYFNMNGIVMDISVGFNIYNNTVNLNLADGIVAGDSGFTFIWWNEVYDNMGPGIRLAKCQYFEVMNNSVYENGDDGLYITDTSNTEFAYNDIYNNTEYAINLTDCAACTIHHNNMMGNTGLSSQGYDNTTANQWDNGTEGNWWSDYLGVDGNGDGIGDTPYAIDGTTTTDRYPLIDPADTDTPKPIPELPFLISVGCMMMFVIVALRRRRD